MSSTRRPAPASSGLSLSEALAPLEAGKTLALLLLSLHASGSALIAWTAADAGLLIVTAAGLLASTLGGIVATPLFERIERRDRERAALVLAMLYGLLSGVSLGLSVMTAAPALLRRLSLAFSAMQGVTLMLAGLDQRSRAAITNALLLVVFACLRGGLSATFSSLGFALLLPYLLAFDATSSRLLSNPARPALLSEAAFRGATSVAVPSALALGLLLTLSPSAPYVADVFSAERLQAMRGEIEAAYRRLLLLALLGGAGTFSLARLLRRGGEGRAPLLEGLEGETLADEELPATSSPPESALGGVRGRVLTAYAAFLTAAEAFGHRRRPADTPAELAIRWLAPREPLGRLTRLFEAARYGREEPGAEDAEEAERAAREARAGLRQSPESDRRRSRPRAL